MRDGLEESSIIAMEDNQLIHLVHGTYDDWRPMETYRKEHLNRKSILFEHISQEGLISITREEYEGDDPKFMIRFQNWHGTGNGAIICSPPTTTHRTSICSATFDEESKRGILVIADGKSRYFCLFQFPEGAEFWEPMEITSDLGVTAENWIHQRVKGKDASLLKRGFSISKIWMFTNNQTKNIRITIQWAARNLRFIGWFGLSSKRLAFHYVLSPDGVITGTKTGYEDLPTHDHPRGYFLDDEQIPHTISLSPNGKTMFHVKPINKENDVATPSTWIRYFSSLRAQLFGIIILFVPTIVAMVTLILGDIFFSMASDIFLAGLAISTGFLTILIMANGGSSWVLKYYSKFNNAFRFHGISWGELEVNREKFKSVLDITTVEELRDIILILSTDGIYGYNLRDGKISVELRHEFFLTEKARFCPSTSNNLVVVYDQKRKQVYEKIFMTQTNPPSLSLVKETEFQFQQFKEPDEEGRRFTEPYKGRLSIKSILMHAPHFQPARALNPHSLEQFKLQKAFKLFGIDPHFDLDIIIDAPEGIWELFDVQGENTMTNIRNWDSLFISKGNITVIGRDRRWTWDDAAIHQHGLHWYGANDEARTSNKVCELRYRPHTIVAVLMSNIEEDWNGDEYDPWCIRRIHSIEGDHQESILHSMAETMAHLYPRPTQKARLSEDMIPYLIEKSPAIADHIGAIFPSIDIISTKSAKEEAVYSELAGLGQFTLWPSEVSETTSSDSRMMFDWSKTDVGTRPFSYIEDSEITTHPLFLKPKITVGSVHADMFGEANTILPLKDHANVIAELMLLPCNLSKWSIRNFTANDLDHAFAVHYKWSMSPSPTLTTNPFEKVLTPPWLRFYEHLPSYGDHIQSEITNTLDDLDQAHFEQLHRPHAYDNTMLRGCTLEYFVLECLLGLSKEQPYVQHADVIDKFVEDRLKDLFSDLGELRIPYDRDFNERTRLVCLKQNPSLPALVLDSVSDLKYSFFENLMKAHETPVFSAQGHPGEGFLKQWKNVNPHFKLVSNITGLIHQNDQHDYRSQGQIAFLLDRRKLLFHSNLEIRYFLADRDVMELLGLDDLPLLNRVDNHLVSPNLETLAFLLAMELRRLATNLALPPLPHGLPCFTSLLLNQIGEDLTDLFYRLWNGQERTSGKARASTTEIFSFEEDLPAASYLLMDEAQASENQPKQPSPERDHSGNAWKHIRDAKEFVAVRELALSISIEGLWRKGRTTRQHHMMHGDLYAPNILLGGEGRLYLCDFSDTVYRREGAVFYRRDDPVEDEAYVSSHFFKRSDEDFEPRINAMADLAWFIATLLLKVPFEPQRNEAGDDVKDRLRREWDNLPHEGDERSSGFGQWLVEQLDEALSWADESLRDTCYLTEGKDVRFRERLKAMVFDGCLRLMAFQLARSPDVANWPYRPEDVARCFGWNKPPMGFLEVREVDFLELGGLLPEKQMRSLHEWGAKIIERGLHPSDIRYYPGSPEIKLFITDSLRARGTLVNGVLKVTSLVHRKKAFEWK
jgi:hypothetical protein